jgi:LytR cell envelope-related transcriptional attenuator
MASTVTRRPLPALIALLALLLLTALVWWRVSSRDSGSSAASTRCATPSASTTAAPPPSTLPPPSSIQLTVLNATSRSGIASKARTAFVRLGFKSPTPAANDQTSYRRKVTGGGQIRYSPPGKDAARLLTYYLPGASLLPVPGTSPTITVALGPKFTAVASQRTVNAALAAAHLTISSAAPTPTSSATASGSPSC